MKKATIIGPRGETWAIAPDHTWTARDSQLPPSGELVDVCFSSRNREPAVYTYARMKLVWSDAQGNSKWQLESGEMSMFNPDFWRVAAAA